MDCNEEVLLYKNTKVKDMLKNYDNIINIKIMHRNLSLKELDQVIHNLINEFTINIKKKKKLHPAKILKIRLFLRG